MTYEAVKQAADFLVAHGRRPTVRAVRASLGRGSHRELAQHLRLWRAEREGVPTVAPVNPDVVTRQWHGHLIRTRLSDAYMNATDVCAAAGKLWGHYYENQETQAFLAALSQKIGITINGGNGLVQSRQRQGTWVHPDVAIHLAQWCDPAFAVEVAQWYRYWQETKHNPAEGFSPQQQAQLAGIVAEALRTLGLPRADAPTPPASAPAGALMAAQTATVLDHVWDFSRRWGAEPSGKFKTWAAEMLSEQALGQKPRMLTDAGMQQAEEYWKVKQRDGWRRTDPTKDLAITLKHGQGILYLRGEFSRLVKLFNRLD